MPGRYRCSDDPSTARPGHSARAWATMLRGQTPQDELNNGGVRKRAALGAESLLGGVRPLHVDATIASAVRWAIAIVVSIGLVPLAVGNADASPIQTPPTSCSSPNGPATEVLGSVPIRALPMWCSENVACSNGVSGAASTRST